VTEDFFIRGWPAMAILFTFKYLAVGGFGVIFAAEFKKCKQFKGFLNLKL
jgi:hypothetical protein